MSPDSVEQGRATPHLDAVVGMLKERYGSIDNFKNTVAQDPVGVLSDISAVLTTGGSLIKGSKIGGTVANVGGAIDPINIAARSASRAAKSIIPKGAPSKMWQSAAKLSTTLSPAQRDALTEVALKHNITPTRKGVDKAIGKIDALNEKIAQTIDAAVDTGQTIPVDDLFRHLDELRTEVLGESGEPMKGVRAINRIEKDIRAANNLLGRDALTPANAQKLKQRIYRELESEYQKITQQPASTDAQKAIARAAKESIEEIVPEIKQLNQADGELIALRKVIDRSAARITNHDIMGLGVPIKGTMGGVVGGAEGATAGLLLGFIDTPAIKSRLAIILNKLKKQKIDVKPNRTLIRLGLVKAGEAGKIDAMEDIGGS
jgi:hypothetical protein